MARFHSVRRVLGVLAIAAMCVPLTLHVSGCSLIGLAGGSIIDAGRPRHSFVPTGQVHTFHFGDSVRLQRRDSTVVEGRFAGSTRIPDAEYRDRFAMAQSRPGAPALPPPGVPVQVRLRGAVPMSADRGELLAFVAAAVEFRDRSGRTVSVPFSQLRELQWDGGRERLTLEDLARLRLEGALPLASNLLVESDTGTVVVPVDDVAWLWGPTPRGAARKGFVLGLVADVVVVGVVAAIASSYRGPFEGAGGCDASPSVYSALDQRWHQALARGSAGAGPS
jgi:hypothetical protein